MQTPHGLRQQLQEASVAGRDDARDDQHGVRQYPPVAARVQRRSHPLRARVPARRVRPVLTPPTPIRMRLITVIRSSSHTRTNTTMRQQLPPCSSMSFSFSIKDCCHRCRRRLLHLPAPALAARASAATTSPIRPRASVSHAAPRATVATGDCRAQAAPELMTVSCSRILSM